MAGSVVFLGTTLLQGLRKGRHRGSVAGDSIGQQHWVQNLIYSEQLIHVSMFSNSMSRCWDRCQFCVPVLYTSIGSEQSHSHISCPSEGDFQLDNGRRHWLIVLQEGQARLAVGLCGKGCKEVHRLLGNGSGAKGLGAQSGQRSDLKDFCFF